MRAWHQDGILDKDFPLFLSSSEALQFPPHWHDEIEVVFVLSGKAIVGLNSSSYTLETGDIIVINPCDIHYYLPDGLGGRLLILEFGASLASQYRKSIEDRKLVQQLIRSSDTPDTHGRIVRILNELQQEYAQNDPWRNLAINGWIMELTALIYRSLPSTALSPDDRSLNMRKLDRLDLVLQYVEENYSQEIRLEDVCNAAHYSYFHFTRFFKNAMGTTFMDYLASFRVRKAEWMLTHTDASVMDIAMECGFGSIKTFNRLYRKLLGLAPTQTRKRSNDTDGTL